MGFSLTTFLWNSITSHYHANMIKVLDFFFYPYTTCPGSKGRQYGNNCLLFRTVELGREPVGLQLQELMSPKRAVCNGRHESQRLGYESEGSPSLAGMTVSATVLSPACRWHWGSACSPCTVPASEALAWYSQFHPAGSGHAYVQFLRSTVSEARPSCSATASCTKADSLSPTRKQRERQVSPKSCHPKPITWSVVFVSVTRRELFLIPPPTDPHGWSACKILILVLTLTHLDGWPPTLGVFCSPVKWENNS